MFKPVFPVIAKKRLLFATRANKTDFVDKIVTEFVKNIIGEETSFDFRVDAQDKVLIIKMVSKALANELVLRAGQLIQRLKEKGISFSRIIVR